MAEVDAGSALARYWAKRDFDRTAEPRGAALESGVPANGQPLAFVVQKHAASRLHYDFRLELGGVLVSWALPKGPSFDPADKRIAVHVEDHPLGYASFEGTIPPKQYGAGTVIVWDNGSWEPIGDPTEGMAKGKLLFHLHGQKLAGLWELVKIAKPGDRQELWILFKKRGDAFARPRAEYDVVVALPDSVIARPLASRSAAPNESSGPTGPTEVPGGPPAPRKRGRKKTALSVPGAVEAPIPDNLDPQLATLATGVPAAGDWRYEIKFDGYRIMCRVEHGRATLVTRGGHDWSARMPALIAAIERMGLGSAWLDGEIVVLDDKGLPSFNLLQKSFDRKASADRVVYFLFDLPYFEGFDLRGVALGERRRVLQALLEERVGAAQASDPVRYSADFAGAPETVLESACKMGLEGLIAKRLDAPYRSHRTETWLKLKCKSRQEFVVCGYTDRSDGSPQVGSLILGVYAASGELETVGSVGTGWSSDDARALKRQLAAIETGKVPFAAGVAPPGRWSKRPPGSERWVEPTLVAEVEYAEMTPDGQIRHASFVGLRSDKPARKIGRERAVTPAGVRPRGAGNAAGGLRVSNPERVIDPSTGLTKLDLVRYYESVAGFILPHLVGRPCSLVRGPTGVGGELFFQKHSERTRIPGLKDMDPALWPGHDALLEVATPEALAGAAQMNVIEFHTWNSIARAIDRPDRMIYDLDPGEGTSWAHIQEAAVLVRGFLQQLGLESWLKTSGGKGLHVVVPLAPKLDYDTVKDFSRAVVQHLERIIPSRFVSKSGGSNRVGKLFVDWIRNGHGATTAAAFSARARPGMGVSMPVAWSDLEGLASGAHWTIATAREHLSFQSADPWAGYWKSRQTLAKAMKTLGFVPTRAPG